MTGVHLIRLRAASVVAVLAITAGTATAAVPVFSTGPSVPLKMRPAIVAGLIGKANASRQQATIMHWTINGVERDALVFAPHATQGVAKRPLVIAFHGHGGHMLTTAVRMHIHRLWPQAIVVYPQGLNTPTMLDPAGTRSGWQGKAGEVGNRDLKLFDAIVATMQQSYLVDRRRIYATGFSNGAVFSLLLWAKRAKTIAAIGEVAGRLDPSETLTSPRALLAVAGRSDTVAPFAVQQQTIQRARQINRASGAGNPCGQYCTYYPSTNGPVPVKTFIHPGGHVYPTWASTEIVKFLKSHKQP
jgi:polyhydroxybutyrate depolymerase